MFWLCYRIRMEMSANFHQVNVVLQHCYTHWKAFTEKNIFWTCCGWLSNLLVIPLSSVVIRVDKSTICCDSLIGQYIMIPNDRLLDDMCLEKIDQLILLWMILVEQFIKIIIQRYCISYNENVRACFCRCCLWPN